MKEKKIKLRITLTFSKLMALAVFIGTVSMTWLLKSETVFIAGIGATVTILGVKQAFNRFNNNAKK